MKIAYHADDAIDGQLVADVLNGNGIFAQVRGAHMQGAVGEAAAMGNVKVWVNDEDLVEAKNIVEEWGDAEFVDEEDAELFGTDTESKESSNTAEQLSGNTVLKTSFFLILVLMIFGALWNA